MVASTELNSKLQKISALMGLLRSDLLELSEAKDTMERIPVVAHVNWIADQLDAAGAALSDSGNGRVSHARQRATPSGKESAHQPAGRGPAHHDAAHKDKAHRDMTHGDAKSHDRGHKTQPHSRPNPAHDTKAAAPKPHDTSKPDVPLQPDAVSTDLPRFDEEPFTPPIPDVPKP